MGSLGNRFIFPAPAPSYTAQSYKRHLCWIPWNPVISPQRVNDPNFQDGIPCLWFPAPKAATVMMFFHANAEDLGMSFAILKHMRDQFKVNVLAVEYPGYGLLQSMAPSEEGVYEVSLTTFRFLVDAIGVCYSQIILFGRSLGSGPAVYLASQFPVGGLILVSAFSSIRAAVQSIVGRLVALAFGERFPNSQIIANVSCSCLFIHGEADGLIPMEHSLRLFKRCRARKLLVTPPDMEHNSNLFGDASYLAVPAIHFFGFPGYYTNTPPRLPASMFETPDRRARLAARAVSPLSQGPEMATTRPFWLCDCLAKNDQYHMDVGVGLIVRQPEPGGAPLRPSVLRFIPGEGIREESGAESPRGAAGAGAGGVGDVEAEAEAEAVFVPDLCAPRGQGQQYGSSAQPTSLESIEISPRERWIEELEAWGGVGRGQVVADQQGMVTGDLPAEPLFDPLGGYLGLTGSYKN
ncbi:unnamed protein product [Polarella glacialis]|uniref:Serine aminopeptidase S33 domain-containing protein n=1 Tax=Polarella glacialis TaxID=89957 RepID=A0A813LUT6_POLGL|nr:unnamed protein product [Polarella glacialis]